MQSIISRLRLAPLPREGGWFRQYYLSLEKDGSGRPLASGIHYLMSPTEFSALHRLATDETWKFSDGAPIELLVLAPDGAGRVVRLGRDAEGNLPAAFTVPAGHWQGARPLGDWALADCTMAPAWDEREFELGDRAELERCYPVHTGRIRELTRPGAEPAGGRRTYL